MRRVEEASPPAAKHESCRAVVVCLPPPSSRMSCTRRSSSPASRFTMSDFSTPEEPTSAMVRPCRGTRAPVEPIVRDGARDEHRHACRRASDLLHFA